MQQSFLPSTRHSLLHVNLQLLLEFLSLRYGSWFTYQPILDIFLSLFLTVYPWRMNSIWSKREMLTCTENVNMTSLETEPIMFEYFPKKFRFSCLRRVLCVKEVFITQAKLVKTSWTEKSCFIVSCAGHYAVFRQRALPVWRCLVVLYGNRKHWPVWSPLIIIFSSWSEQKRTLLNRRAQSAECLFCTKFSNIFWSWAENCVWLGGTGSSCVELEPGDTGWGGKLHWKGIVWMPLETCLFSEGIKICATWLIGFCHLSLL